MTLFFAGVIHAAIILGISFDYPDAAKIKKSLDIVLVDSFTTTVPEKADYLAQENNLGGGDKAEKSEIQQHKLYQPTVAAPIIKAQPEISEKTTKASKKIIVQNTPAEFKAASSTPSDMLPEANEIKLNASVLADQISQLGAEISDSHQQFTKHNRVKAINSVTTHKYIAAAYERAWQQKIERIGNLNYPDAARRGQLSGALLLSVGITSNGTISSIKIHKSSGHKALDDAATRIVRLASPFSEFPAQLAEQADVLIISRTWRFSNNAKFATSR